MKAEKLLVTLYIVVTTFLVSGIALANDPSVFASATSDSTLEEPTLTVTILGTEVTLNWTEVDGAGYYVVHYAQYPYDNPDTIKTIDVGNKTSASCDLMEGSAYLVAVKACDASGLDCSAYSNIHTVIIPLPTSENTLGQEFKLIPAGTFSMGSPASEDGRSDDETQHQVTLTKSFYIQTTEVTQGQWKEVMGNNPSWFSSCGTDCPVENVSWNEVQEFIEKLNEKEGTDEYRLPTEAEWEYACRAGSTTAFYNNHIKWAYVHDPHVDQIGWYDLNSAITSHPVAQKTDNAWGLYDMSGNVWELCQDWYGNYPSSAVDPTGPSSGNSRVFRGGSWDKCAAACRSAKRGGHAPHGRRHDLGFRLARTL